MNPNGRSQILRWALAAALCVPVLTCPAQSKKKAGEVPVEEHLKVLKRDPKQLEEFLLSDSKGFATFLSACKASKTLKNDAEAQYFIGFLYSAHTDLNDAKGSQKSSDLKIAEECFKAAAGYPQALYCLAAMKEKQAAGKNPDAPVPPECVALYKQAAESGKCPEAEYKMSTILLASGSSEDGYKNYSKYLIGAANGGIIDAQYKLVRLYLSNTGVQRDYVESYKWYYILKSQGCETPELNTIVDKIILAPRVGISTNDVELAKSRAMQFLNESAKKNVAGAQ